MAGTLQSRRRDFVASEISRAAMRLFAARSFDDVTVDEIAAAAGISSRTFFRYFASKDDILLEYQRRLNERLVATIASRPPDEGPVTALRSSYLETSRVAPEDRAAVAAHSRILYAAPLVSARALGEGVASASAVNALLAARMGVDPARDDRPHLIAVAMSAVAGAAFRSWVLDGGRGDPSARIGEALALLERGLGELDHVARRKQTRRP